VWAGQQRRRRLPNQAAQGIAHPLKKFAVRLAAGIPVNTTFLQKPFPAAQLLELILD
jgi:hypothetical protein